MLTLKKVAVTGGVASGKTTVCRFLMSYGAFFVSADEIVRQLLKHDRSIKKEILEQFGTHCLIDKEINRQVLGKIVFNDPEKLRKLEAILHPAILREIQHLYDKAKKQKQLKFFVAEVPLLFEIGWEPYFDITIAVYAGEQVCKNRWQNDNEYDKRMARYMPTDKLITRADISIKNEGSLDDLKEKTNQIIPQLNL